MRDLIVSEFISLDGVIQGPGAADEDTDGNFTRGGWVPPYFTDEMGAVFGQLGARIDALLLGRRTYVGHANAFEPDPAQDPFGDVEKFVVSRTLEKSLWRRTTILRDNPIQAIREIKARPGKAILTDGSSQLVHALFEHDLVDELHLFLFPVVLGGGKRLFPKGVHPRYTLVSATPFKSGVVDLAYRRAE